MTVLPVGMLKAGNWSVGAIRFGALPLLAESYR
jgi:hypothetical protein